MIPKNKVVVGGERDLGARAQGAIPQMRSMGIGHRVTVSVNLKAQGLDFDRIARGALDALDDKRTWRNLRCHPLIGSKGDEVPGHGVILQGVDQKPARRPRKAGFSLMIMANQKTGLEGGKERADGRGD